MNYKSKKGFTLIELIVVIAIIAILMLILVPTMNGFIDQAKNEANLSNAKAVYTAMVAQDTAAKTGMNGYESVKDSIGEECSSSNLDPAFYNESLVGVQCTYDKDEHGIKVTWNYGESSSAAYPVK